MLATLPPELQRHIVESTVPHTFHTRTYLERQSTLRSLCLVSHGFRQIAQPLLFEIVWIDTWRPTELVERLNHGEGSGAGNWGNTRCLVFTSYHEEFDRDELSTFVGMFPLVRKINLYETHNVEVSTLKVLTHLTELQLHITQRTRLTNLKNTVLSTVRCVTLYEVRPDTMTALLNPAVLPNLAVFALFDDDEESLGALAAGHFDRLLPQLEGLFFDYALWQLPRAAFLHSLANRTLIDIFLEDICSLQATNPVIVNARISDLSWLVVGDLTEAFFGRLDHLASVFENSQPSLPLRLLYLDISLEPSSSNPPRLGKYINRLATACRARKVEIVYEETGSYQDDFYISPDFVRRQEERREVEQQ